MFEAPRPKANEGGSVEVKLGVSIGDGGKERLGTASGDGAGLNEFDPPPKVVKIWLK